MKLLHLFEAIDAGAVGDIQAALRQRHGVHLDLRMGRDGIVDLEGIQAPKDAPPGTGTAAMEDLVRWADQNGVFLTLQFGEKGYEPVQGWKKTSSQARLKKFYARFGFKPNKGRYKRFDLSLYTSMYREPKKAMNELVNIQSPQFKKWFGKSKVVDKSGRPMMVFHGTSKNHPFEKLAGLSHFGTLGAASRFVGPQFAPHGDHVQAGQRIYPVYLRIKKPINMVDSGGQHSAYVFLKDILDWQSEPYTGVHKRLERLRMEWMRDGRVMGGLTQEEIDEGQTWHGDWTEEDRMFTFLRTLKEFGHDGIRYINAEEDAGSESWVPLDEDQILYAYAE